MKNVVFCIALAFCPTAFAADGPVMDSDNLPRQRTEVFQSIPAMTIIVPMDDDGANQAEPLEPKAQPKTKNKSSSKKTKSVQLKTEKII